MATIKILDQIVKKVKRILISKDKIILTRANKFKKTIGIKNEKNITIEILGGNNLLDVTSKYDVIVKGDVGKDVNAGGNVTAYNIGRDIEAEGNVTCTNVKANIYARGNINCFDVGGNVSTRGNVTCTATKGDINIQE